MAANPGTLRFDVDESAVGLGKALAAARRDTVHVGHALVPECPLGVLDPDWIPAVARRRLVVIGHRPVVLPDQRERSRGTPAAFG